MLSGWTLAAVTLSTLDLHNHHRFLRRKLRAKSLGLRDPPATFLGSVSHCGGVAVGGDGLLGKSGPMAPPCPTSNSVQPKTSSHSLSLRLPTTNFPVPRPTFNPPKRPFYACRLVGDPPRYSQQLAMALLRTRGTLSAAEMGISLRLTSPRQRARRKLRKHLAKSSHASTHVL